MWKFVLLIIGALQCGVWAGVAQSSEDSKFGNFANASFRVSTVLDGPFVRSDDGKNFEGFLVDLMNIISTKMGFSYSMHLSADGRYGIYNPQTRTWQGIIGEVVAKKADMGVAPLTVTSQRMEVVDFVLYQRVDITVLYKDNHLPGGLFHSLLTSISWQFLALILVSYFIVALFLYLVGRVSPYQKSHEDSNNLSLWNSLWVTASCLFLRGPDVPIRSVSARLLVCVWWLFSFIVVLLLISSQFTTPASFGNSLQEFLQRGARFGVVKGGSTNALLKERPDLRPFYESIEENDSYCTSITDCVESLLNGRLDAAFLESTSAQYYAFQRCDLKLLKESIQERSFGIALPKESQLRSPLSRMIVRLQETGEMDLLKQKWWGINECCKGSSSTNYAPELDIMNSYPLFIGLFALLLLCFGIANIERIIGRRFSSGKLDTHY